MTPREEAIALVCAARTPEDLFGGESPKQAYRRLARLLHPDLAPGPETAEAFAKLAGLWAAHGGKSAGTTRGAGSETVITTRRGTYRVGKVLRRGATAVLYESGPDTLLKVPRSHADNDLMRREADALRTIEREGDPLLLPYVPRLVESFRHRSDGVERQANVISRVPEGFVSLAEITRLRPVLDPRDAAWIWRRLLVVIGAAHKAGVVHGAVFGHHVLVHPLDHGLVLVDWSQSVPLGSPLTVLVARHRDDYPREVLEGRPATEATDIRLATRCVAALMGDRAPAAIRRFVRGSLIGPPRDAWRLLSELDDLLDDLYGPRKYRPLHL
ncbi:lipopolysaccharide kinase InaA family protein [Streptosporangium sp. NPDC051023]|uniref:lipopolysaccharide kinase InaA family protein n=1 Tax=Streptosporangium sp. NPDC051023 TaxID=3155410 RepID=UPI00344E7E75